MSPSFCQRIVFLSSMRCKSITCQCAEQGVFEGQTQNLPSLFGMKLRKLSNLLSAQLQLDCFGWIYFHLKIKLKLQFDRDCLEIIIKITWFLLISENEKCFASELFISNVLFTQTAGHASLETQKKGRLTGCYV